ncbi:retinoblastoma-like protein 2 isoform X3 [Ictidomys tridecemlineatus]|uniref:Retinoblastoma-like protein 2 n=1 Tax=Ictidomys tridecemlineatus TaxID=43179 RepID=I3N0Z0_ICTTR|nr:retinoblastoma-like protein 2 isoform X1 [Ictidomys tridecemlineatus]XP_040135333.1 retinoblastoma-like protein 2 isoform X1 [Ictidomys tridecemlineatus]KAG3257285.1 RB transcriptional corepressor like 2, transcript variant X1 [Ictidomys tridecemlineatus]
MPSGGDQSPPPPPPPPVAAGSDEEEEDDGEAEDAAQPAESPTPQIQQRFDELCSRLNMDEAARAEAWDSYRSMSESYTLEGNDLHWLACALYVACRKSVPTVSKGIVEGNYVSLTRILRCSEQSLIEFFNKMKKWEDMANLPPHFRERTERLERNFTVSAVIFKKYEPIFQDIFKYPQEEQPRQQRGRKQRRQPCTVSEIFHFCWVLFIYAKGNFPMISDDLVNSYHLLLCALDLVYGNALQCSNRKELVNPNFKGLCEDFHTKDFKPSSDPPCVIEKLCSLHDGLVLEAKGIKEHFWKPYIRKLYEKKLLKGKEENLTGFLEPGNFGESFKAINKAYEEYVLSVGNLDERIFLGEDAEEEIGTLSRCLNSGSGTESAERVQMKNILQQHFDKSKALRISTPLTGVRYIKENSPCVTPISTATHSLSRLHTMLTGLRNAPSEKLEQILRTCSRDPTQAIANRLKEMYEIYSQHSQPDEDFSNCAKEIASKHFRFAEMLYYKVLESVIEQEQKRLGDMDLSGVLEQDAFHRSLLACCLEVVTFSYKPPGNFPFITEIFDVPLYHFYKVIEVFIRAEDGLCREVVKHLNQIEEQILDHLAWKPESPLWDRIRDNENRVPTCEEVMPPQNLERADEICITASPLTPRRVSEVRADTGGLGRSMTSPTSLYDRYSSPTASTTRRRLFAENDSPSDGGTPGRIPSQPLVNAVPVQNVSGEAVSVTPVPGQTLVTMATATVTANNGQTVTIPVQGIANENGGITFFPVQVNVGGQAQAVTGSIQPLSAQALTGSLSSQQVTGTTLQVPGQVAIQQISPGGQQQKQGQPLTSSNVRPRKTSSLSLFFRKVYHLAGVRLRDLCAKLDISDELRKKIWTCFEFSIIQCTELMMDRHLDQLLMCAIYVMAKVTKEDKSFQNIMRCYRTQPQARSQVYRSVLIKGKRKRRNSGSSESRSHQNSPTELNKDRTSRDSSPVMRSSSTLPVPQPSSAPPTPTRLTGANSDMEEEERGDLIQFYNNIYIKQIKTFAMKYSQANIMDAPPLSPYPFVRTGSPRRIQLSQNHPVYISPHKNESMLSPREKIFYYFSNSPSKRLREINSMIRTGETPTKKRGILLEDGSESPAKRICPENHSALLRRLQDVANDRGSH